MKNLPASIQARLRNIAIQEEKSFDLVFLLYLQERFLYRLSISPYEGRFILKGGLLLFSMTQFQTRPTKDIDFLAQHISHDVEVIKEVFQHICRTQDHKDGVVFDERSVQATTIKEGAQYEGVRIKLNGFLGKMVKTLQFDIGFGDAVIPKPRIIDYPVLLDADAPKIKGYSLESVVAEKFEAMITLSEMNSRMKDFYDLFVILDRYEFDGRVLQESIFETFQRRGTHLVKNHVLFSDGFIHESVQKQQWGIFIKRLKINDLSFATVIKSIRTFLHPIYETILQEDEFFKRWDRQTHQWY